MLKLLGHQCRVVKIDVVAMGVDKDVFVVGGCELRIDLFGELLPGRLHGIARMGASPCSASR